MFRRPQTKSPIQFTPPHVTHSSTVELRRVWRFELAISLRSLHTENFYVEILFRNISHVTVHPCNVRVVPYFESEFHKIKHVLHCELLTRERGFRLVACSNRPTRRNLSVELCIVMGGVNWLLGSRFVRAGCVALWYRTTPQRNATQHMRRERTLRS